MKNVEPIPSAKRNPKLVLLRLLQNADQLEALSVTYKIDDEIYTDCCDYLTAQDLAFMIAVLNNQLWHLLNDTSDGE